MMGPFQRKGAGGAGGLRAASGSTAVREVFSFIKTLAVLIVLAIFLRGSVVEAFKIPSGSMIPTLHIGDHILVTKFSYGLRLPFMQKMLYEFALPKRGDIVVFTRQSNSSTNIIKRVVGLPGDTIEVAGTTVLINNVPYYEDYARWVENGKDDFGPITVPAGHVFLLGDNRDQSCDSRCWEDTHFLDAQLIKGRALIIYWSWSSLGRIGQIIR